MAMNKTLVRSSKLNLKINYIERLNIDNKIKEVLCFIFSENKFQFYFTTFKLIVYQSGQSALSSNFKLFSTNWTVIGS